MRPNAGPQNVVARPHHASIRGRQNGPREACAAGSGAPTDMLTAAPGDLSLDTKKKVVRRRAAPAHADARLRALTEHALEIITIQDDGGAFTYANDAVIHHLGYHAPELLGRNALEFLHPDDATMMRERF